MSDELADMKETIRNLLSEAVDLTENRFSYVNNVQLYFGANEVILDLYFLGPNNTPNASAPQAQRIHRIVLPVPVAKEMAEILLNGITTWEDNMGISLPLEAERPFAERGKKSPRKHKTDE